MRHCIYKNVAFVYNEFGDYMIEFTWNNVAFLVTDIGGGVLGKRIPRHAHALNCYELHFITNGRGELETDDRVYHLKRGDFFITSFRLVIQNGRTPLPQFFWKIHFRSIAVLTVFMQVYCLKNTEKESPIIKVLSQGLLQRF